jgi:DNA-binding NtrC family response regulator
VRELQSTIRRAVIWSDADVISADDVREALLPDVRRRGREDQMLPPVGDGVDLNEILDGVEASYLDAALEQTAGNKTRAAALLGLKSQQTLSNRLKKTTGRGSRRRG